MWVGVIYPTFLSVPPKYYIQSSTHLLTLFPYGLLKSIPGGWWSHGLNSCIILNSPLASSLDCSMFAKSLRFGGGVGVRELFMKLKPSLIIQNLKEGYFYPREEINSEILTCLDHTANKWQI